MRKILLVMFSIMQLISFVPISLSQSQWSIGSATDQIPNTPIYGEVFGRRFELGSAEINDVALTFKSKAKLDLWPESEIIIFVSTEDKKTEWDVTPDSEGMVPHVHMKFAKEGKSFPGTFMYIGEYSMKLSLTEISDDTVKGKIHISLPDYKRSYLIGSFTAKNKMN